MKYRKKPVVVDAFQITEDVAISNLIDNKPLPFRALGKLSGQFHRENRTIADAYLYITTLEGRMKACFGDYVIRGIKGEYYPCKPDIFEATYELAEDLPPDESKPHCEDCSWYRDQWQCTMNCYPCVVRERTPSL